MLKIKKFLPLALLLGLFCFTGCGGTPQEKYPVTKASINPDTVALHLTWTVDEALWKKSYKNGEELSLNGLTVKDGNGAILERKNKYDEKGYFLCTQENYPTNTIVTNLAMTTNAESSTLTFYVATVEEAHTYVSTKFEVTITNENALKPWVWFVITGAVAFIAVAMVVGTRKYKASHGG